MNPFQGDLIWVLLILVLLFGASKLPQLARSLGQAKREFRQGMKEGEQASPEGECPFCGVNVPPEAQFCPGCGKSAEEIVAEKSKEKSA